ncbi:hypothetical protein OROMI_014693 [Orobanche minor]
MCYMKNSALKPAVFPKKLFSTQPSTTTATAEKFKTINTNLTDGRGGAAPTSDDGFQIVGNVGKAYKQTRGFPPPNIANVGQVGSNPFHILSEGEDLHDGQNLEDSTQEPCLLDKDLVVLLHNLGPTNPPNDKQDSKGPLKSFHQEDLVDVVILDGSTSNANGFFFDGPDVQNPGPGTSKSKVNDNISYYSADELEGVENYNSDGSVHSGHSLPDHPISDHVTDFQVVGSEMIL